MNSVRIVVWGLKFRIGRVRNSMVIGGNVCFIVVRLFISGKKG